jgi:hypothetical protein
LLNIRVTLGSTAHIASLHRFVLEVAVCKGGDGIILL